MKSPSEKSPTTQLIHHPYVAPSGFEAPQPPVYKASTVIFPSVAAMRSREWKDKSGYTYGLHGTPTTFLLEERLCSLEGGEQCLLVPSGLSAIATVSMALLRSGDQVLLPDNAYGPNKALAQSLLKQYGIEHDVYQPLDLDDLERKIAPSTRLVWLEAPGSVTMEFPDLKGQVRVCQERGVLSALDNTWGAGIAFSPFDLNRDVSNPLGVDISAHALTKYPSGGGDVLMGSIVTRNPVVHMQLKLAHMHLGLGVGANDVEAILRALPSIGLRYQAHDQSARILARWLEQQPQIVQVLHPALEASPGHHHWRALCLPDDASQGHADDGTLGAAAGLFSVVLDSRYAQSQVDAFCDALRLFKLGFSWGGPISLVVPYELGRMRAGAQPHLAQGTVVRFSIGLEDARDLQDDLKQALQQLV